MNEVDSIRLEQFRQLKKGIRGSKEHLIVGIDVAKERHRAFFGTATGKTLLKRLVFENTSEGFERLLIQTEALKAQHNLTKTVFGLEPTANYRSHQSGKMPLLRVSSPGTPGAEESSIAQETIKETGAWAQGPYQKPSSRPILSRAGSLFRPIRLCGVGDSQVVSRPFCDCRVRL